MQPPSLNTTRILASRTARKIFADDSEVSEQDFCLVFKQVYEKWHFYSFMSYVISLVIR